MQFERLTKDEQVKLNNEVSKKVYMGGYTISIEDTRLKATKQTCSVYIPITNDDVPKAIKALEKALGF